MKGLKILFTLSDVPLTYGVEMYSKLVGNSILLSTLKLLLTYFNESYWDANILTSILLALPYGNV